MAQEAKQTKDTISDTRAMTSSAQSSGITPAFDSQGTQQDWVEPTLADLDRSIPQVDCKFIADLIRTRNVARNAFLEEKETVKGKIAEMVRARKLQSEAKDIEKTLMTELSDKEREALSHMRPEYDDGFVLIDCRTVNEVTSWGIIEGAKVLPAHEMFEAFHLTPERFHEEFGFAKPRPDQTVIFYCTYGPRSLMAAQILSWMGYENVLHFREGYHEWAKQFNLLVRRWMEHDRTSGNNVKRLVAFEAAKQLQREVAPEFNALTMQEAKRLQIDETRSRGTLRVGEGVRERALKQLAGIAVEAPLDALPGTISDGTGVGSQKLLHEVFSETTGIENATQFDEKPRMTLGEAQSHMVSDMIHAGGVGGTAHGGGRN